MKQIYRFDGHTPPPLAENRLRTALERRRRHRQTALSAAAGLLLQAAVALLGYSAVDWYPWISAACFGYIVISGTACGVAAITYLRKEGLKA